MRDASRFRAEIHTGLFDPQDPLLRSILGENAAEDFHRYFHWYNILHELGHAVMDFNCPCRPHPAQEEQWVNDFAVAFWQHNGGADGLKDVQRIVRTALCRLQPPAGAADALAYALTHWGQPALYTFSIYGWFQFSLVEQALQHPPASLAAQLQRMGVAAPVVQEAQAMPPFSMDDNLPHRLLAQSVKILRTWGVSLPEEITLVFSADPNCHMLQSIEQ